MPDKLNEALERLFMILANEASQQMGNNVSPEAFKKFVMEMTQVKDWPDDFIIKCYESYLQKITNTAEKLNKKN